MTGLPWFKFFTDFSESPKTLALQSALEHPEADAYVVRLLCYVAKAAATGRVEGPYAAGVVERAIRWPGAPGRFVEAALAVGFLERDGEALVVCDWADQQGAHVRKVTTDNAKPDGKRGRTGRGEPPAATPTPSRASPSNIPRWSMAGESGDVRGESRDRRVETTTPLSPPSPSAKGGAPGVRDAVANVVPLPPARRARADASALAVASASPPPDERDEAGLLPFESGAPPGEDLPSQLQAAFQGALGAPYRWDMRRDERAVNELLVAAGPDGRAEVLRRWRIGLANQGFPRVRSLSDLVKRWNDCAQPAGGGGKAGPPRASDGLAPSASDVCEGCGRAGEGARYGGGPDGHVFLGYGCGCGTAWTAELQRGRPYTEAPKWVREYRNRGAR